MTEADLTNAILKVLHTVPESFWYKHHGGMYAQRGIPDILGVIRTTLEPPEHGNLHRLSCLGRLFAFEVKMPGKKLTPWQVETLAKIRAAGGVAERVESVLDVENVLARHGIATAPRAPRTSSVRGERLTKASLRKLLERDARSARRAPTPAD